MEKWLEEENLEIKFLVGKLTELQLNQLLGALHLLYLKKDYTFMDKRSLKSLDMILKSIEGRSALFPTERLKEVVAHEFVRLVKNKSKNEFIKLIRAALKGFEKEAIVQAYIAINEYENSRLDLERKLGK